MGCTDMLIKLYELDEPWRFLSEQKSRGIIIRKPLGAEKQTVVDWVRRHFSKHWSSEAETAMAVFPKSCFIAVLENSITGFCSYDAAALGFCGPIGVKKGFQGNGIGKALLLASLFDMKMKGYGYAVVGWVEQGMVEFYRNAAGAVEIPGSFPGIFQTFLGKASDTLRPEE